MRVRCLVELVLMFVTGARVLMGEMFLGVERE
jgi:hypothetical protein